MQLNKAAPKSLFSAPIELTEFFMNWRIFLVAAILFAGSAHAQNEITLEDIWKKGTFRQNSVYGLRSMKDGDHYTTISFAEEGTSIEKWDYKKGDKVATLLTSAQLKSWSGNSEADIESYAFSKDEQKLLISWQVEKIYRHSSREKYFIVDLAKKSAKALAKGEVVRNASFSPDGKKVGYVQNNNLFIEDLVSNKTTQVTQDGEYNKIINGYADWVYEEEFAFHKAYHWSPDGNMLAYYRFDESAVKEFHMPIFSGLYPENYSFKYPKAGEVNSKVTIHLYNLTDNTNRKLDLGSYEYIPRIKWTQKSDYLAVMKMPRLQNILEIDLVNTKDLKRKNIYKEVSDTYIEISDDLTFYGDNAGFIWRSEKSGFFHLYSYNLMGDGERQLTKGNWEVREFIGYSSDQQRLYFAASTKSPVNQEIYSVGLNDGDQKLLSPEIGTSSAAFNSKYTYYILNHTTANDPLKVSLYNSKGKEVRVLEDNAELREILKTTERSKVEFMDFTSASGVKLNGWMVKPVDFDPSKKYPVLMYVYGGPGSQTVNNSFSTNMLWYQMLASKGYIVASFDNRGTGARGKAFRTQTYQQLGKLETEDQISAAKWLGGQSYVDASRIGIWGWSYGGYMSSLCLFKGADVFKTAMAVAPVSNWRFYDSIYTERYMGLPQENADGYDDNSPINFVEEMKGNYLLVHGTADDNVHFQNAVELVEALIQADKHFDFNMYPDRNHGIYGGNTRYHLYTKMTEFVLNNL